MSIKELQKTLQTLGKFFFTFYTNWAVIMHGLFVIGLIPNTWVIALHVVIISQLFYFVYPNYYKKYGINRKNTKIELLFHWGPLLAIPFEIHFGSLLLLIITWGFYYCVHGRKAIRSYYIDLNRTIDDILHN